MAMHASKAVRKGARSKPSVLLETLEARRLCSVSPGTFFVVDSRAGEGPTVPAVTVSARDFMFPASGRIGLRSAITSGTSGDTSAGAPIGAAAIDWLPAGQYLLPGSSSPAPDARSLQVSLVGDVNGDYRVDATDVSTIRSAIGTTRVPRADVNGDGRVDVTDVGLAQRNRGAATRIRPLALTTSPTSPVVASPDGPRTRSSQVTIQLTSTPGSRLTIANERGGLQSVPLEATGPGRGRAEVGLAMGRNTIVATATTVGGQRVVTTLSIERLRAPLLVLPGYLGSVPTAGNETAFGLVRGFPAAKLEVNRGYSTLMTWFDNQGYTPGVDLFAVPYDWRLPLAKSDGRADGVLALETVGELTRGVVDTQVDYLGRFLVKLVKDDPSITTVDVIGHSNGNMVTRAYVQSAGYGGTFKELLKTYTLPTVGTFVQLAAPDEGAALAWNPWNNDIGELTKVYPTLGPTLTTAYDLVASGLLRIVGLDRDITRRSITDPATGKPSPQAFLRQYFPSLATLNPTYGFLVDLDGKTTNINTLPGSANVALLDLNGASKPGINPWLSLVGKAFASYGVTLDTVTRVTTHQGTGGFVTGIQDKGIPQPTVPGQIWYEPVIEPKAGDGVVPLVSLESTFVGDPRITLKPWGNGTPTDDLPFTPTAGAVDHMLGIIANPDVLTWVVQAVSSMDRPAIVSNASVSTATFSGTWQVGTLNALWATFSQFNAPGSRQGARFTRMGDGNRVTLELTPAI
jgi:hypothetical protein